MATIYHDADADPSALAGQRIAVLGFGSQGHAHAQNLKDSGHDVRVGLREGSRSWSKAEEAGLSVRPTGEAVAEADVVMVRAPRHGARRRVRLGRRAEPEGGRHADVRARVLGALRDREAARRRRRHDDRPQGPGSPGPADLRGGDRHARARRGPAGRDRQRAAARPRLRRGDRRRPGGDPRDHLQGGDRDRPVRRAVGAVRRDLDAGGGRVRHAGARPATSPRSPTSSACTSSSSSST